MSRILVIGESCLDIFSYCDVNRFAPDLPIPILTPNRKVENGGMAQNVYRNISSLNYSDHTSIITNNNWRNITKERLVHETTNHTFLRIDSADKVDPFYWEDWACLNDQWDAIVIADYNKGFLSEINIEKICNRYNNVFLDTKKILGSWANNAKFIKINNYEYKNSLPFLTRTLCDKIIHTDGANGAYYRGSHYHTIPVEVKDSSGAGDTFMAGLVYKYQETGDIGAAINFANVCAAKVVKERGVTIA